MLAKTKFLSLFSLFLLLSTLPMAFCSTGSNKFLYQSSTGTFDTCTEWGMTSSGVQSGQYGCFWNSSNPSGYALRDNTGFNVHVNLTRVQCTNPPLDWTNWFTGMWDTAQKDLNVNLTLCDLFGGKALSNSFLIDSHSSLWGASSATDLHYGSMVNASVPIPFPSEIDLGFFRSGNTVTAYMQFINQGVKFDNGSYAPVRLTNTITLSSSNSLLSNGLLVVLEISHAGSGDVDISFVGSETTSIPAGWDFTQTVKQGAQWYTKIVESLASLGALFMALIGVAGVLIGVAPYLLLMFIFSMLMACMMTMSIQPLRDFVDFVWRILNGTISAITGIADAVKNLIQWW